MRAGAVMTVEFELNGQKFLALNGGPGRPFSEAISLMIICADQDEVDYYWSRLAEGGQEVACGWVTDRYGLSWQVVPAVLMDLNTDPDRAKAARVFAAMLKMTKLDIATLEEAVRRWLAAADPARPALNDWLLCGYSRCVLGLCRQMEADGGRRTRLGGRGPARARSPVLREGVGTRRGRGRVPG